MTVTRADIRARDQGRCARCGSPRDLHVHHRVLRAQGGADSWANMITLCAACHRWVHDQVAEARDAGWLVTANGRPAEVPVAHFCWPAGPVQLLEDGMFGLTAECLPSAATAAP